MYGERLETKQRDLCRGLRSQEQQISFAFERPSTSFPALVNRVISTAC
jgi:hypothetical protein